MSRPARSRDEQRRTAVVGAATKPLNILVPVVLVVLAILIQPWLALAAIPVYAALVVTTLRDPKEVDRLLGRGSAGREGRAVAPGRDGSIRPAAAAAKRARAAAGDPRPAADDARGDGRPEALEDLPRLLADMLKAATGARDIDSYLQSQDVASLRAQADDAERDGRHDVAGTLRENLDVIAHLQKTRTRWPTGSRAWRARSRSSAAGWCRPRRRPSRST